MKLLIAVMTCHRLDYFVDDQTTDWLNSQGLRYLNVDGRRAAQRETWLSPFSQVGYSPAGLEVNYKFFYGQQLRRLDVKPNQRPGTGGPAAPLRPASYDEIYLPCGDGYVFNSAKMKEICRYAINEGYDYILRVDDDTYVDLLKLLSSDFTDHDYSGAATGAFHPGSCMFLSRSAMGFIVSARITNYADDLWIGQVMENAGIPRHDIDGVIHGFGREYAIQFNRVKNTDFKALHSVTPDVMRKLWTVQTMSSLAQQKGTDGTASEPTQSVSVSLDSVDEKSSSDAISPTSLGIPLPVWDSSLSNIHRPEITPLSNGSESSVIGYETTSPTSDTSSIVT